jgi:Mg2+ and Co2+ transporter CorA
MNVAGVPGTEYAPAFRLSLVFMSALAVALLAFFRWKRWI